MTHQVHQKLSVSVTPEILLLNTKNNEKLGNLEFKSTDWKK